MLAKTFTVIFALTAVSALSVLAVKEYVVDCNKYLNYLNNEERQSELTETRADDASVATTIQHIRNEENCNIDVLLPLTLEHECEFVDSDAHEEFYQQMAKYVWRCSNPDYWDIFISDLKEAESQSTLNTVFPECFIDKYEFMQRNPTELLSLTSDDDEKIQMIAENIENNIGTDKEAFKSKVIKPCEELLRISNHHLVWIGRGLSVVADDNKYLDKLSEKTRRKYLLYEICESILEHPRSYNQEYEIEKMYGYESWSESENENENENEWK